MDFLLPVPLDGLDGRGPYGPRHWRDIPQSAPRVITEPTHEPISRAEAKQQIRSTVTDEDSWLDATIQAARLLVEADTNRTFVRTVLEMTFDQFPIERWIPLPRPPLISVQSVSWFDILTSVETTVDAADYVVDTYSQPGRLCLAPGKVWPIGVRWLQGGKIRWTAGHSGVPQDVAAITRSDAVATVRTSAPHGWATGKQVTLAGADQEDYNGTFEITRTGAATFTIVVANAPATPATGVITAVDLGVPARYLHAMKLLIANWDVNRESSGVMRGTPDTYPLGYDALIGDRLEYLG